MATHRIVSVDCEHEPRWAFGNDGLTPLQGIDVALFCRERSYITQVGILPDHGRVLLKTQEAVVDDIKHGASYYVENSGKKVKVIVAKGPIDHSHEIITTTPDQTVGDNLLALPRCTPLPPPPPHHGTHHPGGHGGFDDDPDGCDQGGGPPENVPGGGDVDDGSGDD